MGRVGADRALVAGLVATALGAALLSLGPATAAADQPAPPVPNPPLSASCGIKVAVVLDESGSIGGYFGPTDANHANFTPQVRDSFRKLVDALAGTGSTMLVTEFADNANTAVPPTAIDGNEAVFESYITSRYNPRGRGLTGEYHTNWEAGLEEVRRPVQNGSFHPDLVIMLTDGEANKRYPWLGGPALGSPKPGVAEDRAGANGFWSPVNSVHAVDEAIDEANYLKGRGIRLFGVGVNLQPSGENSMARVAGATRWNGDPSTLSTSDYVTYAQAAELENALALIGTQACSTGVTVNKVEDRLGQRSPGSGWEFTVAPSALPSKWLLPSASSAASRTRTTGDDGQAAFAWVTRTDGSSITVREQSRSGWALSEVSCTVTGGGGDTEPIPHTPLTDGFRLDGMDVGDKASCEVVNVHDGTTPSTTTTTTVVATTTVPPVAPTTAPSGSTTTTVAGDPDEPDSTDEVAAATDEPPTEVGGTTETNLQPLDAVASVTVAGLALTGALLHWQLGLGLLLVGCAVAVAERLRRRWI